MTLTAPSPAGNPAPARPLPYVPGVTHRFVMVRGVRLHVAEAGSGDPVLLLHSFPQHWYAWRRVIPLLAGQYRLICPDWRGFGWSQAPARGYDTASRAADLLALMDALGLPRVRLVGHDWGAHAAFIVALRAPERVSHLLAVNAAHPWLIQRRLIPRLWRFWYTALFEYPGVGRRVLRHGPALTRFLLRYGAASAGAWPSRTDEAPGAAGKSGAAEESVAAGESVAVEEFVEASREPGAARAGEALHWQFVRHDIPGIIMRRHRGLRLAMPAVILAGGRDRMLPPGLLAGAERHADDLRLRVVPDAGHFLPEEDPAAVAETARELFGRG